MTEQAKQPDQNYAELPLAFGQLYESDDPETLWPCINDANGHCAVAGDTMEQEPLFHYIVWAANNAPALAARLERLEAALQFYADPENWEEAEFVVPKEYDCTTIPGAMIPEGGHTYLSTPVDDDYGQKARKALEAK